VSETPAVHPSTRWAAVVVNYNAGAHLRVCIESVLADTSAGPVDVVVVDNASTDGSLASIDDLAVRIVHSPGNVGYARAANLGAAVTTAPIVAVLNTDLVVAPGTAAAMCAVLDARPEVGVVGPSLWTETGEHYPSARQLPGLATSLGHAVFGMVAPTNRWTRRYRELDVDPHTARDPDWLSGAALWLRRTALDAVGGWDERFFMFLEDVDLCARLREQGWVVSHEPKGSVVHVEGVSRRSHPYRTIVAHHRSAYRYATIHWRGPRRVLLPVAAAVLGARALVLVVVAALRARSGS
jgi:N-acetylglucosaminyl-diphospho-decaprenol L-rhamnosyltransferase